MKQLVLSEQILQFETHYWQELPFRKYCVEQLEHAVDVHAVHPVAQLMQAFVLLS